MLIFDVLFLNLIELSLNLKIKHKFIGILYCNLNNFCNFALTMFHLKVYRYDTGTED